MARRAPYGARRPTARRGYIARVQYYGGVLKRMRERKRGRQHACDADGGWLRASRGGGRSAETRGTRHLIGASARRRGEAERVTTRLRQAVAIQYTTISA